MALSPEPGATYVLSDPAGYGQGLGALAAETEVEIESVRVPDTEHDPGAIGDVVVLVWNTVEHDGEEHRVPRRIPLSMEDFERLFSQPKAGDKK